MSVLEILIKLIGRQSLSLRARVLVLDRLLPMKPVLLAVRAVLEVPLVVPLLPAKVSEQVRVLGSWIGLGHLCHLQTGKFT